IPSDIPGVDLAFYVIPVGEKAQFTAHAIATNIRLLGYSADVCFDDIKLAAMFKRADKKGAKYAIIIGEEEINNHKVIIKNLATKEQIEVDQEDFENKIVELMEEHSHDCSCGCHDDHGDCGCECHDDHEECDCCEGEDCDCDCHDGEECSCGCHEEKK
ncbi:MAG TPA: His/Gly/Thr/Pro-type tRNA ligase C-terminal domain-containing protein, partial [Bacilli bacterium]|nr:His/Gly/Thr/Pro-type tRNA ligase C-terminal domain-containing protein [Bacilli bacterium]